MESTIQLFSHLVDHLPPLLPDDLSYRIRKELKNIQTEPTTLEKLEEKMIQVGYEIWPWHQAFREFLRLTEDQMGEEFLLVHLDRNLQKKYYEYRQLGMSWQDIHTGRTASYFVEDDRIAIAQALVATHRAVRDFATRAVVGMKRDNYLKKVEEFRKILVKIKDGIDRLRDLAIAENDHPMLANEIVERVKSFEHGLCLLAPEFEHAEVDQAHEFFVGRKQELNRLRGIHETIEIDFYSEV